jgi:hypothetical protein
MPTGGAGPALDVDANNQPIRPSAGGGGISKRLGPLPLWGWGLVAAGMLGFFWWQRSHGSSSSSSSSVGAQAGTDPNLGVGQVDPLTADALMQSMQDLATRLAGQGNVTSRPHGYQDVSPGTWGVSPSSGYGTLGSGPAIGQQSTVTDITNALNGQNGGQSASGAAGVSTVGDDRVTAAISPVVTAIITKTRQVPRFNLFGLPVQGPLAPMKNETTVTQESYQLNAGGGGGYGNLTP